MKSFKAYSDSKFTYYNSIQSICENNIPNSYEELISKHGSSIDSILYKMNLYNKRFINNNFIKESNQDVLFNIDEQFAARDILINIANQYIESLCNDFCQENEILIDESAKDFLNKIGDAVKAGSDKVTKGFKELGTKISKLKQFIKEVMSKAIKSAKELIEKINDLMLSIGGTLSELVIKLGGEEDLAYPVFKDLVEKSFKDEKVTKENVYESLSNKLNSGQQINEEYVFELFGLGKKKKEEKVESENEYDKAAKAKEGGKVGNKLTPLADAGLKIFLQLMAYYAVTVVLPAVITLIAGPLAGAIVECVAKVAWSGATIYKQVKDMRKLYKSEEYKKMSKVAKVFRWAMFFVSLFFAVKAGSKGLADGYEIGKKMIEGATEHVLPSDMVRKVTELLNNFQKSITGSNTSGYDAMLKAQETTYTKFVEITSEGKEASDTGKEKFDMKKNTEFNKNETNNFDHYNELGQEELSKELKAVANAGEKSSKAVLDNVDKINVSTPGTTAFAVDGATLGKIGREEFIKQIADKLNVSPSDIDISQVSDVALRNATNGQAGTFFTVIVKGDATSEFADLAQKAVSDVATNANMGGGYFHMLSKVADNLGPVQKAVEVPINVFKNSFANFAGLLPIASKFVKNGGFKLRLGSARTGNHLYEIEEVKEMPFNEVYSNYGKRNETVFKKMAKIVNDNNKLLKDYKDQLDSLKKMDKEQKKKHKLITQQLEKMKDGSTDYKLLIFLTKDEFANKEVTKKKKEEKAQEAKDDNLYPVAFFNPMILAGGDLAPCSSSKKPRANIYFAKGLFSRWELLPIDGGMSKEDIINMFTGLMKESLKACYNMAPDVPCKKDGDKYVENVDSQFKGKERQDFGGFTNEQLTEIFNSPDEVTKYLGGKYATDTFNGGLKHEYSERDDEEYLKTHHDKVIKEYIEIIKNDDELIDMIKNSDSLKTKLLDDEGNLKEDELEKISDNLIRVEQNYLQGEKKKGMFDKIKKWFKKDKDEGKENSKDIDPTELRDFAFKLASKWKKYRNKKGKIRKDEQTQESLEEYDIDFTIFNANLEIFENEFINYFNNETINESYENDKTDLLI